MATITRQVMENILKFLNSYLYINHLKAHLTNLP